MLPEFGFYSPTRGGLWIGKRYSKKGKTTPDPLNGISHAANVRQVCRFYYLLATGRLINPERSRQILNILSNPGIKHKFVKALKDDYPGKRLFRKSGTWKKWHSDSILVWGRPSEPRYILVVLIENAKGTKILKTLAEEVDALMDH